MPSQSLRGSDHPVEVLLRRVGAGRASPGQPGEGQEDHEDRRQGSPRLPLPSAHEAETLLDAEDETQQEGHEKEGEER